MIPGELLIDARDIALNVGRKTVTLTVSNTGDRPIQVGSHYHFFETNPALSFERKAARGFRLNIAAGTAVRFEPGQERTVELVALAGDRVVFGFNALISGRLDRSSKKDSPPPCGEAAGPSAGVTLSHSGVNAPGVGVLRSEKVRVNRARNPSPQPPPARGGGVKRSTKR